VPPSPIRRLRDLTRYRTDLVVGRTAEKQRVEKLLEDAQIKLSVVASEQRPVSWTDGVRYDLKLWTGTLHESATYPPA
jgi:transposase